METRDGNGLPFKVCDGCGEAIHFASAVIFDGSRHFHHNCAEVKTKTSSEAGMILFINNHLATNHITAENFFRAAYYWRFEKIGNVGNDVRRFIRMSIVPSYVAEYVRHLQG